MNEAAALIPAVVTVTPTVPAPGGLVAAIWVSDAMVKASAGADPNCTLLTQTKPVPVMVTGVPPAMGPLDGEIPVTLSGIA